MSGTEITIVSGLPRSGTSMMMRMLTAGGLPALADQVRLADEDNPLGYFELELVKELKVYTDWLSQAEGKCIKIISHLLEHLPDTRQYAVIFIERDLDEVLSSQARMLARRGVAAPDADEGMRETFQRHLASVNDLLNSSGHFRCLRLRYHEVVADPSGYSRAIRDFLALDLDTEAMAKAVDTSLYRNRLAQTKVA